MPGRTQNGRLYRTRSDARGSSAGLQGLLPFSPFAKPNPTTRRGNSNPSSRPHPQPPWCRRRYTHPMEILINFMERDNWSVHCVTADARTEISPFMSIKKKETLLRLLRYVGAGDVQIAEVELNLPLWARGCCSHPARARAQESAQAPQALERWSRIASSCHVRPLRSIHRHRGDLHALPCSRSGTAGIHRHG